MSNKNYNKMYRNSEDKENVDNIQPEVEEEVTDVAEDQPEIQMAIEEIADPVVIEEEPEVAEIKHAVVVGCAKLNVREEPAPKANVVAIIDASNEVVVHDSESFGNYYKVCTASGVEGYCVKDYLELK